MLDRVQVYNAHWEQMLDHLFILKIYIFNLEHVPFMRSMHKTTNVSTLARPHFFLFFSFSVCFVSCYFSRFTVTYNFLLFKLVARTMTQFCIFFVAYENSLWFMCRVIVMFTPQLTRPNSLALMQQKKKKTSNFDRKCLWFSQLLVLLGCCCTVATFCCHHFTSKESNHNNKKWAFKRLVSHIAPKAPQPTQHRMLILSHICCTNETIFAI